jgi:hypothetical protein
MIGMLLMSADVVQQRCVHRLVSGIYGLAEGYGGKALEDSPSFAGDIEDAGTGRCLRHSRRIRPHGLVLALLFAAA